MTTKKKVALSVGLTIGIPVAIILSIAMFFLTYFGISALKDQYAHRGWTEIDYCNDRWEVKIPDATIEYTFSNRDGWLGDGETYTVCGYSSRPDEFLKDFKADTNGKNVEKYNRILPLLQSSNVDKNKLIEPDENYIWFSKIMHSNCTLLLAYNEQTNKLYILEDFM